MPANNTKKQDAKMKLQNYLAGLGFPYHPRAFDEVNTLMKEQIDAPGLNAIRTLIQKVIEKERAAFKKDVELLRDKY